MISETEMNEFALQVSQTEVNRPEQGFLSRGIDTTTSITSECLTTITSYPQG
ncbi:hypothetical protein [Algoriphagus sp. NG3]|uniref:hypothetical protein n=1 Tax=Algoriphagus sp. NG3 TaxID=3097546 RepID=UPI002A7EC41B|nr:hypothetical protein [Algoriphagus sp. NG3]WPR77496.1 hypothetical protein SLW71_09065 [Algoriphagus sp. NG3]